MRKLVVAVLATFAVMSIGAHRAQAYPARHAFCLQGDEYPGWSFCNYDTYAQCRATASGIRADCVANPFFTGQSDDPYAYQNRGRPFPPGYYPAPPNPYYSRRPY